MTGCSLHPRSRVRIVQKQNAHEHTGSAENTPAFPAQWLYGLYRALPGEPRRCCRRRPSEALASSELDASIRASGPHDFTVRSSAVRYRHISVHRIPPHVRDDHDPPLLSGETGQFMAMICPTREVEYF